MLRAVSKGLVSIIYLYITNFNLHNTGFGPSYKAVTNILGVQTCIYSNQIFRDACAINYNTAHKYMLCWKNFNSLANMLSFRL